MPAVHPPRSVALAGGLDVAYVECGVPDGPPLVFVHGVLADHRQWHHNLSHFARLHRVLAIDLPGHGGSSRPPGFDYSIGALSAALLGLLDRLGIERCTLVGNSLGGHVSLVAALEAPERIERLVLVDPAGSPLERHERLLLTALRRLDLARFYQHWMHPVLVRAVLRRNRESDVVRAFVREYDEVLRRPADLAARLEVLYGCLSSVERDHLGGQLGRVEQPARIVWGRSDLLIHRRYAHRLARELPNSEVRLLEGVGHVPSLEVPDLFHRHVDRFLARTRAPRRVACA